MGQSRNKFLEWAAYIPVFWDDFVITEKIIHEYYYESARNWTEIHTKAWDVVNSCDNLEFDMSEVEAYCLFHFLDRYHRFQMIYSRIFARGYFPTPHYPSDVLDIGSGPAPSLFALSDFVKILNKFGAQVGNPRLANLKINLGFLERSESFRCWISKYKELAPSITDKVYFDSFQAESFEDFQGLDLRKIKREYRQALIDEIEDEFSKAEDTIRGDLWVDHIETEWKHKFRYNMIIMSNFLTNVSDIDRFESELIGAGHALRNNGILVIITGATQKYDEIIYKLKDLLVYRRYDTRKNQGKITFGIKREKMSHNWEDLYGARLIKLLQRYTEQEGYDQYCSPKLVQAISSSISNGHVNKWYLTVFQKRYKVKPAY